MRYITILLFLMSVTLICKAQLKVTGIVQDSSDKNLEFATVALYKDNSYLHAMYSDSLGQFSFMNLQPAVYQLKVSFMNTSRNLKLTLSKDTMVIILLPPGVNNLNGVTINGTNPLIVRKVDRMVFNVEGSIA